MPNHVGAAHDVHVLVAGGLDRAADRLLDAGHECERTALGLLLRPVRDDEERQAPRVLVAPVPGRLVGPASTDDRSDAGHRLLEPGGVLAGRLASRLRVVRPRAAEDPVVQPLAALAEPLPGPSFGPVMYPSTDVVIAATTFVIALPSFALQVSPLSDVDPSVGPNSSVQPPGVVRHVRDRDNEQAYPSRGACPPAFYVSSGEGGIRVSPLNSRSANRIFSMSTSTFFAGLERADDRVGALGGVRGGVLARRVVTAPDVTAAEADPQVQPLAAVAKAVFAACDLLREFGELHLVEVRAARGHHL